MTSEHPVTADTGTVKVGGGKTTAKTVQKAGGTKVPALKRQPEQQPVLEVARAPLAPPSAHAAPRTRTVTARRVDPAADPTPAIVPDDDVLALLPNAPGRPPDRRWRVARRLHAGLYTPRRWADEWVRLSRRLLALDADAGVPPALLPLAAARDVYVHGDLGGRRYWTRVAVEAALLAGETPAAVAARTGLAVGAVAAYRAVFFDVADVLTATDHVAIVVVGLHDPRADTDAGVHVRHLAYIGGPLVLDALLDAFVPGPFESDVPPAVLAERARALRAVAFRMTPVDNTTRRRLLLLHALHRELPRARR